MDALIGTADGLYRLADTSRTPLVVGRIAGVSGDWVVVDDSEVLSLESGERVTLPLRARTVVATDEGALVGTAEAHLFHVRTNHSPEQDEGFDAIPTRDGWYTPWGAPPDTRSLARTADGVPLVNVHVGGVWRLEPYDAWQEVVDVECDTHQVVASPDDPGLVIVAAAVGFGQSGDGGRTFRWTTNGLHASYSRAAAIAGDHVLVSASTGPSTKRGAVYRRPLASDEPFVACTDWFPYNIDTHQLAAEDAFVAVGTEDGDVLVSTDAGATWETAARGFPPIRCVAVR